MRPSPSPLKPPLEVSETFGVAKVSDNDQLKKKARKPNTSSKRKRETQTPAIKTKLEIPKTTNPKKERENIIMSTPNQPENNPYIHLASFCRNAVWDEMESSGGWGVRASGSGGGGGVSGRGGHGQRRSAHDIARYVRYTYTVCAKSNVGCAGVVDCGVVTG